MEAKQSWQLLLWLLRETYLVDSKLAHPSFHLASSACQLRERDRANNRAEIVMIVGRNPSTNKLAHVNEFFVRIYRSLVTVIRAIAAAQGEARKRRQLITLEAGAILERWVGT